MISLDIGLVVESFVSVNDGPDGGGYCQRVGLDRNTRSSIGVNSWYVVQYVQPWT